MKVKEFVVLFIVALLLVGIMFVAVGCTNYERENKKAPQKFQTLS